MLGKALLSYGELLTVLCEVEGTINSRPLTYLNEDDLDSPLTPFHLIYGRNILSKNNQSERAKKDTFQLSKRVNYLSTLIEYFWKRFYTCYLGDLKQANLHRKGAVCADHQISVGDIVLLKEELLPRNRWRLGPIEKLVVGRDGHCRGARLTTSSKAGQRTSCSRPL